MAMFYFGAPDFGDLKLQHFSLKNVFVRTLQSSNACLPRIDDYDSFRTTDSRNLKIKNLSEPIGFYLKPYIWWCMDLSKLMAKIPSGLWDSNISVFKTCLAPLAFIWSPGSGDAWLSADRRSISFQVFGFWKSQNSNPLLAHFFLECFFQSTWSVDACRPTDQRFPTTSAL